MFSAAWRRVCSKEPVLIVCATWTFWHYVYSFDRVSSRDMLPTLHPGDIVVIESWPYCSPFVGGDKPFQSGDIVSLTSPLDPNKEIFLRVRATAGQVVAIDRSVKYITAGQVWLAGDQENALDSRVFGPVPIGLIRGKVLKPIKKFPFLYSPPIPKNDDASS